MDTNLKAATLFLIALLTGVMIFFVFNPQYIPGFQFNRLPSFTVIDEGDYGQAVSIHTNLDIKGSDIFPEKITLFVDDIEITKNAMSENLVGVEDVCVKEFSAEIILNINKVALSNTKYAATEDDYLKCVSYHSLSGDTSVYTIYSHFWDQPESSDPPALARFDMDMPSNYYYAYPFDNIRLEYNVYVNLFYIDSDGNILQQIKIPCGLNIYGDKKLGSFDITYANDSRRGDNISYAIELSRSVLLRYFAGLLLFFLVLIPPIIPLVESIGNIIEISIAFFIGIWGFRQIIVPNPQVGLNLIDLIFLSEYSLVLLSLTMTIIYLSRKRNRSNNKINKVSDTLYSLPKSKVFHSASCPVIAKFTESSLIKYDDIAQGQADNKRPCKFCL